MIKGLSNRDNSFLIGFVMQSLFLQSITIEEAHQWIYTLIKEHDDLPPYMYCLLDAKNSREFRKIIDFNVYSNTTAKEADALRGISFLRGYRLDEEVISRIESLRALKESPQLEKRFRETFPFIEF